MPDQKRILVVEDDPVINQGLTDRLSAEGHDVIRAYDGPGAVAAHERHAPDLVVLDLMLPGFDGLEVTKPFRMREVVARVAALLRRVDRAAELVAADREARPVEVGTVRVDPGARRVTVAGAEVHLTPTEFDLLLCLARAPGRVQSRERLLAEVWGWAAPGSSTRTVDSHVKSLRRKIGQKVGADLVRTVHGVGYALEPGA